MPIAFGRCVLDTERRALWRDGAPVHVQPRVFDLLAALLAARPRALSKDELLRVVWRDTFVADSSLARAVADARAAIGESAHDEGSIRTLHGFGYAFAGTVREADGPVTGGGAAAVAWLAWGQRAVPLPPGAHVIGRETGASVRIDLAGISRRHARLTVTAEAAVLEDLGSKNGTFVGGVRLDGPVPLEPGDRFSVSSLTIEYRAAPVEGPTITEGQR
jgi:DNA-binding winged helix-turn-helix (wHTH) protein